jgi:hypothetical protein
MKVKAMQQSVRLDCAILSALVAVLTGLIFVGTFDSTAYAASSSSTQSSAPSSQQMPADSAGTAFSGDSQLVDRSVSGDLIWGSTQLQAQNLTVGKDLIGAAGSFTTHSSQVAGDLRFAGQTVQLDQLKVGGNATILGREVSIGDQSQMRGLYVGAGDLDYRGTAQYVAAYANSVYFDGTVNGDVTLSAQDIEIGPHAKVTGTLNIRSGQTPYVPDTAQIASIDTSLNNPNAIDFVSETRAKVAPYFQIGSILFIVVASIVVALLLLWIGERQLYEAHRALRRRPFGQILLGLLSVVILVVATIVCLALVLTIPAGLALLFLLLASALVCVPFAGASLGLAFGKFPRTVRAIVGAGIAGALLCVPYVRWVVFAFSLIYLIGYLVRSLFVGHDAAYLESFDAWRRVSGPSHSTTHQTQSSEVDTSSTPTEHFASSNGAKAFDTIQPTESVGVAAPSSDDSQPAPHEPQKVGNDAPLNQDRPPSPTDTADKR